jgi:beta-galactosidase
MKRIFTDTYIPFGTQYYRAPSPQKEDWDNDLKKISGLGINTVKFWVQWRWNNPSEDEFYFDDIDELMEIALKYKLKVMLNTIFDVAPAWIYRKYSDASMVTLNGRQIAPQTQPHRQIGGLGYCFNNDNVTDHQFKFLSETVKRYKDHPALEIWNVGSEPELTSSMAEMRLYADNYEKMGDMLCYCHNCRRKFKIWLQNKYGDIKKLNAAWNRNYRSFKDAELPKTRNTFNDIIDWRMFFVHTIGENVRKRFEVAKNEDNGEHPLMCHHVFIQGFPVTSTANDPWNIGQYGDLHGFTQMDDAMMIDLLRSCAKGKPVISAEMLMLMGYTLDMPRFIDENDIKKLIFRGVAGNLKGFIFWQYRPEILGREAPSWGLTTLDGKETSWLLSFAKIGNVLQQNAEFLLEAGPNKTEVAILYNPENQIFAWASTGNEKTATNSLLGVHKALYEHNINVDFIHPMEFENNVLDNYKALYIPFPYVLSESICKRLKDWVNKGGLLIGESYFAGWNLEEGHHEKVVPGYNMHEVFKARQGLVEPALKNNLSEIEFIKDMGYKRKGEEIFDGITKEIFKVSGGTIESIGGGTVEMEMLKDLPFIHKGDKIQGSIVKEILICEGAEVLAKYFTGEPAITYSEYGKGKAILIGSYIGLSYFQNKNNLNGNLIASLVVEYTTHLKRSEIIGEAKIRVDILTKEDEIMLILQNQENVHVKAVVKIPVIGIDCLTEQFSQEKLSLTGNENNSAVSLEVTLLPKEVKVYRA